MRRHDPGVSEGWVQTPPLGLGWVRRRRGERLPSALSRVVFWPCVLFFLLSPWLTLRATPQGRFLQRPGRPGPRAGPGRDPACAKEQTRALIQARGLGLALGGEVSTAAAPALWLGCSRGSGGAGDGLRSRSRRAPDEGLQETLSTPSASPRQVRQPLPPGSLSGPSMLPLLPLLDPPGRGDADEALGGNGAARFSQLFKSLGGQLNLGSCQSSVWSWISVPAMQGAASSYRLGQGLPGAQHASV